MEAQKTSIRGSKPVSTNTDLIQNDGKNYIFTIGINAYDHWSQLDNAVNDAKGVHRLFTEDLGFDEIVPPIFDKMATKSKILSDIENILPQKLTEKDNLIFFFSGHGMSYKKKIGTIERSIGYIVPVDGENVSKNSFSSYIKASQLMSNINELPAKHILVILDACKSGIAINSLKYRDSDAYSNELQSKMSRNVITSAGPEQVAADGGPISGHSLFTGTLIDGFKKGMIDKGDRNGLVTSSEIGLYLQQIVAQHSQAEIKQTPDFGSFGYDAGGELVIDLNDDSLFTLKSRLNGLMQSGRLTKAWKLLAELEFKYPDADETAYYKFRKALEGGEIDLAIENLEILQDFIEQNDKKYYLNYNEIWDLTQVLRYWRNFLTIKNEPNKLRIELIKSSLKDTILNSEVIPLPPSEVDELNPFFELPVASSYQFRLTNLSENAQFIYAFFTNTNGSLSPIRLFDDWTIIDNGIPRGSITNSNRFQQKGLIGIEKFTFIISNKRQRNFESPLSPKSRGAFEPLSLADPNAKKIDIYLHFN